MMYPDGQYIELGDKVMFGDGSMGVVVSDIDNSRFSVDYSKEQWGYLKKGVMIHSLQLGLIHMMEPDSDLFLVSRINTQDKSNE